MPRPAVLFAALSHQELTEFLPDPQLAELRGVAGRYVHCDPTQLSADEFYRALAAANPEVLVTCWKTPPLPSTLPPALRYVCHLAGSIKHLVKREQIERGLIVSNWGGSISRIVAEWALFHILSCLRRATHWTLAMHQAGGIGGAHFHRVEHGRMRPLHPLIEGIDAVLVHQETDAPELHAIHRRRQRTIGMQRAQHEAIAAQGHDHIGLLGRHIAIAVDELALGLLGDVGIAGDKGEAHRAGLRSVGETAS